MYKGFNGILNELFKSRDGIINAMKELWEIELDTCNELLTNLENFKNHEKYSEVKEKAEKGKSILTEALKKNASLNAYLQTLETYSALKTEIKNAVELIDGLEIDE